METQTTWFEEMQVRSSELDFQEHWKPDSFFQAMVEAASHHANHLGFDYEPMLAQDHVWILSRVRIRFRAFPGLGDTVRIETWPKGIQQRLLFMRDFLVSDGAGQRLAEATTAWLLIKPSLRRILPPGALEARVPDNGGRFAIREPLGKLTPPEGLPERMQVEAGYSAIDLMGHVTNSRYLEWIADAFSLEEHAARRLAELQINYTSEVLPGESVRICSGPDPAEARGWWLQGIHPSNGASALEAYLRFS